VRFASPEELEAVERAARVAGVATGALIRVCALRYAAAVAARIAVEGKPARMRRRS
jgi:hypothetical protein